MLIWFNLLVLFNGQVFWLGSYETQEECQVHQKEFEAANPGVAWCPFVKVEKT